MRRIVLLGKSPTSLRNSSNRPNTARVVDAAQEDVGVGQPEGAGKERAFRTGEAVITRRRVVAAQKTVDEQAAFHRVHRAAYP